MHRLIRSTVRVRRLDLPTGDAARYRGWDGIVDAEAGNAWVPDGQSVWEMGVAEDSAAKTTADYETRLLIPWESTATRPRSSS